MVERTDWNLQVVKAELFSLKNYCDINHQPVFVGNCSNISTIAFPDIKRKLTGCTIKVLYEVTYRKMLYPFKISWFTHSSIENYVK